MILLVSFAAFVVLVLAIYAVYLVYKVKQLPKKKPATVETFEPATNNEQKEELTGRPYIIHSIAVIAQAMVNDECNISEGTIRLKNLIDNLFLSDEQKKPFEPLETFYLSVKDFDTHEARNQLPEIERKKQDRKRHFLEAKHQVAILEIAQRLVNNPLT